MQMIGKKPPPKTKAPPVGLSDQQGEAGRRFAGGARDPLKAPFQPEEKWLVGEYWLHVVFETGCELRFAEKPDHCLTLHVWETDDTEFTATYCIHVDGDDLVATPYGQGWKRLKTSPPSFMQLHTHRRFDFWQRSKARKVAHHD
jgi:hypothetical protein